MKVYIKLSNFYDKYLPPGTQGYICGLDVTTGIQIKAYGLRCLFRTRPQDRSERRDGSYAQVPLR